MSQSESEHAPARRQWHRLFGIALTDLFSGTSWRVELEKELALQSQLLDVVIIEQTAAERGAEPIAALELPAGLEGLRRYNLLTYKSHHEALDAWALEELVGHYVNYRKLLARPLGRGGARAQPPESAFQLYAVTTRYPDKLAGEVALQPTDWEGVFDLRWGARLIRVIVLNRIAAHPRNAPWELFSARLELVRQGIEHYQARHGGAESLLHELYLRFKLELPDMAYTMADFLREHHQHVLRELSADERAAFLQGLSADERLRGLPAEERLQGLDTEALRRLQAELNKRLN